MLFIDFCLLSEHLSLSYPRASSKCLLMATLEMQLDKGGLPPEPPSTGLQPHQGGHGSLGDWHSQQCLQQGRIPPDIPVTVGTVTSGTRCATAQDTQQGIVVGTVPGRGLLVRLGPRCHHLGWQCHRGCDLGLGVQGAVHGQLLFIQGE